MKETDFSYTCVFVDDEFSLVNSKCSQTSLCTQPAREENQCQPWAAAQISDIHSL